MTEKRNVRKDDAAEQSANGKLPQRARKLLNDVHTMFLVPDQISTQISEIMTINGQMVTLLIMACAWS